MTKNNQPYLLKSVHSTSRLHLIIFLSVLVPLWFIQKSTRPHKTQNRYKVISTKIRVFLRIDVKI
jgi:hypothetical protein